VLLQATLAFLALPGVVAILVPVVSLCLSGHMDIVRPLGFIPLVGGFTGLLWCVRDFYVSGRGTLAPWAPPAELVTVALYRYSRNPMYVSVTSILLGWGLTFASTGLLIYAAAVFVAFHLRVVLGEEPWLARTHGARWDEYARRVRRWL
jgi:protein-S-isoprenylcysteine O-methyltransferase Ste14